MNEWGEEKEREGRRGGQGNTDKSESNSDS